MYQWVGSGLARLRGSFGRGAPLREQKKWSRREILIFCANAFDVLYKSVDLSASAS